jgi:hypothetical protein
MGCGGSSKPNEGGSSKPNEEGKDDTGASDTVGGALDDASLNGGIAGWAFDSNQPDTPIKVDIYDGDAKLETVLADEPRGDLKEGYGNGKHAFNRPIPDKLKDGKPHTIHVIISGTKKEVLGSPKTFKSSP